MKALEKTFDIVDYLATSGSSELGEIASRTDLPKSTVHHHLNDLEKRGFVINDGGTYRLGLRFLDIGEQTRRRSELFQIVQSEIDELAQTTHYPVTVFVLEQGHAVVLYTSGENPSLPTTLHAGQHLPLHATAAGKAILSARGGAAGETTRELARLESYTENTITDAHTLEAEVRQTMDRGYAIAEEERWHDRCGIAVPFSPESDNLVAAVEVSFSPEAMAETDFDGLAGEVERTVSVINIKSDYSL